MDGRTIKSLSAEEETIISNIESLITQLRQVTNGEATVNEPTMAVKSKDYGGRMDIKAIKGKLMKGETLEEDERLSLIETLGPESEEDASVAMAADPADISNPAEDDPDVIKSTASDSADERVSDGHEKTTGDAVSAVGGDLSNIVKSITTQVLKGLDVKLQPLQKTAKANADAIVGLMDGLGLVDEIQKSVTPAVSVQKSAPVVIDAKSMLELMQGVSDVQKSSQDEPYQAGRLVEGFATRKSAAKSESRSNMGGALSSLLGVSSSQRI